MIRITPKLKWHDYILKPRMVIKEWKNAKRMQKLLTNYFCPCGCGRGNKN